MLVYERDKQEESDVDGRDARFVRGGEERRGRLRFLRVIGVFLNSEIAYWGK
jgi:hypothetical protein